MRFRLVYQGSLPASGNRGKIEEVARIRSELSPQFEYLWQTHNALQVLSEQAFITRPGHGHVGTVITGNGPATPREMAQMSFGMMDDLCAPIPVEGHTYKPLVRSSLHLNCELDILFLRQENPGQLVFQGGELDNRIKTLLDALRVPSAAEQAKCPPKEANLWCLMQEDTLVSALNVETDRLLVPQTQKANEVMLVIEVSLVVLRVHPYNTCLL